MSRMAFVIQHQLDEAAERRSQANFATLSEKDQRRFTALYTLRLGPEGIIYVAIEHQISDNALA